MQRFLIWLSLLILAVQVNEVQSLSIADDALNIPKTALNLNSTASTLLPRRPFSASKPLYGQSHSLQRRTIEQNGQDYVFVGYHGTCSNHQASIESKITLQQNLNQNFDIPQVGEGFYLTDNAIIAVVFGSHACRAHRRKSIFNRFARLSPIVCSIYIKHETLQSTPKVFIPPLVSPSEGKFISLYHNQRALETYMKLFKIPSGQPVIKFAEFTPTKHPVAKVLVNAAMQTAWPREVVDDMIAECKVANVKNAETVMRTRIKYKDMVMAREHRDWGEIKVFDTSDNTFGSQIPERRRGRLNFDLEKWQREREKEMKENSVDDSENEDGGDDSPSIQN
ncbi:hypothetical protein BKA69DRAFT_1124669 [Paraphysoderma sedebokerense]|nr:hypothetical protein BKA69DRAFT_1124669 [Paraphysoderma sedebokerense]